VPVRNHAQAILSMFWTRRWTPWHGDHEIPCDLRARGLHRARVVGIVVAWVRDGRGGVELGVESRDLTQIDRSREALREERCL
jgi:hypothetical protein